MQKLQDQLDKRSISTDNETDDNKKTEKNLLDHF